MENATLTCATEWKESNLACIFSGASILVKISHVTSVVVHFNEMHKNLKNRQLSVKFWPGFAPESVSTSVIVPFFLLFVFRLHHHHHLCPGPPLQEILALWHFHLNSDKKNQSYTAEELRAEDAQMLLVMTTSSPSADLLTPALSSLFGKNFSKPKPITQSKRIQCKWLTST